MKTLCLLISTFLTATSLHAQSPGWLWVNAIGGTGNDNALAITVDTYGNVYTTGSFQGTVDFDPGTGIFSLTPIGGNDMFILKTDIDGQLIWAKQTGGTISAIGNDITIDHTGSNNIYITGYFYGTADFNPGPGTFNMTSAGYYDMFISKLDSAGNFIWAKQIGGVNSNDAVRGNSIAIDNSGNVYTTGNLSGSGDFDPGSGTYNLSAVNTLDIFVLKLDSSGNFSWAKAMGGASDDNGLSLTLDASGNVYTTGYFRQTVDFDPGIGVFNLMAFHGIFISKLDSSGSFVWAIAMNGTAAAEAHSIGLDPLGNIYITGVFSGGFTGGTIDFDPGPAVYNLTAYTSSDFICKLNNAGNFVWVKQFGDPGKTVTGNSIVLDAFANVYTTGTFGGNVDFDPGPGSVTLTPVGISDIFICKIDSSGNFVWAKAAGGTDTDIGHSIALDISSNVYVAGIYRSPSVAFDISSFTNAGFNDLFVAKLDTAIISGVHEAAIAGSQIQLFPNPAVSSFNIVLNVPGKAEVTISDKEGKIIHTTVKYENHSILVDTKGLAAGIYFVRVRSSDSVETKKIIITK